LKQRGTEGTERRRKSWRVDRGGERYRGVECGMDWRESPVGKLCGLYCLCVLKKRLETQRHRGHGEEKKELEGG
jgi:hypothetical protein